MTSLLENEIDNLISGIDKGLIDLYCSYKSKSNYKYIDFESKLKRLLNLFADTPNNYRRNSILNYYFVFKDLYSESGYDLYELKEIRLDNNTLVYKIIQSRPGIADKKFNWEVEISEISREGIERGNLFVGQEPVFNPYKKIYRLLEHCKVEEPNDLHLLSIFVENHLLQFYKHFGFNEVKELPNGTGRYDSYIREILVDSPFLYYNEEQEEKISEPITKEKNGNESGLEEKTLFDIWLKNSKGNKGEYEKYIAILKQPYNEIGCPFIQEINKGEKPFWNKIPAKGWKQYLAAFIYTCMDNKWIAKQYSAPLLAKILCNTFDFGGVLEKQFLESIAGNPPASKYLKPFEGLPKNS